MSRSETSRRRAVSPVACNRRDARDDRGRGPRPFLYFPLRHHVEQNFHVRHRLDRYSAGRCMDFERDGPSEIATAIAEEIGRDVEYRPVASDGAARAAAVMAELL